jgi:hypothetical protein
MRITRIMEELLAGRVLGFYAPLSILKAIPAGYPRETRERHGNPCRWGNLLDGWLPLVFEFPVAIEHAKCSEQHAVCDPLTA